jgi:hypothetical protein
MYNFEHQTKVTQQISKNESHSYEEMVEVVKMLIRFMEIRWFIDWIVKLSPCLTEYMSLFQAG